MKTRLTGVAFALTVVAAVYLLVCPTYSGFLHGRHTHATALEVNGPYVLIPILFPALTALMPLLFRKQAWRVMATILIWGLALLGGFTIGFFYIPAAIAMLLAACVDDSARLRDAF